MKWFVGLGNPGAKYAKTRHNIGFMAIDHFAEKWGIDMRQHKKCNAWVGEGRVQGKPVVLLKPMTYMNLSGEAVRAYMDYYKAKIEDLVVIYDDLDIPFGKMRLRYKGSAGGHNGMKSIIQHVQTQQFHRIRLGISRPDPGVDIVHYVLSDFSKTDLAVLEQVLDHTSEAIRDCLEQPFDKVMAKYNSV